MPPLPLSLDTDTTAMLSGGYPLELSLDNVYWIQYTDSLTDRRTSISQVLTCPILDTDTPPTDTDTATATTARGPLTPSPATDTTATATAMGTDMEDTDTATTATTARGPLMLSPDMATTATGTAMDTATVTDMEDTVSHYFSAFLCSDSQREV